MSEDPGRGSVAAIMDVFHSKQKKNAVSIEMMTQRLFYTIFLMISDS